MEAPTGGGIELAVVLRFVDLAVDALATAREEIDALNVYPVPDGDTGTNMYLTVEAARDADAAEAAAQPDADLRAALAAFARGALLGARGNSGVILSQLLGALCRPARPRPARRSAPPRCSPTRMALATEASYAAVGAPVEGTILSVARAAADGRRRRAARRRAPGSRDVVHGGRRGRPRGAGPHARAAAGARATPASSTPAGAGSCVLLDAAETALTGDAGPARRHRARRPARDPGAAAGRRRPRPRTARRTR